MKSILDIVRLKLYSRTPPEGKNLQGQVLVVPVTLILIIVALGLPYYAISQGGSVTGDIKPPHIQVKISGKSR